MKPIALKPVPVTMPTTLGAYEAESFLAGLIDGLKALNKTPDQPLSAQNFRELGERLVKTLHSAPETLATPAISIAAAA